MTMDVEQNNPGSREGELSDIQKIEAQSWLAEYQASRAQIEKNQEMQHNLLWVNTSAAGAIVTTAIALSENTPLAHFLLAIPIISGILGVLWVSMGMKTITVSNYIREKITSGIRNICQNPDVIGMETYFRENAGAMSNTKILNVITIPAAIAGITFVLFCVFGLVISGIKVLPSCDWELKALWWFALVLTIFLVYYGFRLGAEFRRKL